MLILHLHPIGYKLFYKKSFELSDHIVIDDKEFHLDFESRRNDGFIGFFDWLRHDEVSIVGVRMCFFEHHGYNDFFFNLPYMKPSFEGKCAEILFKEVAYNADMSGDQDFSQNYVYKSFSNDAYLITFNLDHLTDLELNSLLRYCS